MFNMGRLELHPVVDEQKILTVFPMIFAGGTRQFSLPGQT